MQSSVSCACNATECRHIIQFELHYFNLKLFLYKILIDSCCINISIFVYLFNTAYSNVISFIDIIDKKRTAQIELK